MRRRILARLNKKKKFQSDMSFAERISCSRNQT
jgi:hypothetical protein